MFSLLLEWVALRMIESYRNTNTPSVPFCRFVTFTMHLGMDGVQFWDIHIFPLQVNIQILPWFLKRDHYFHRIPFCFWNEPDTIYWYTMWWCIVGQGRVRWGHQQTKYDSMTTRQHTALEADLPNQNAWTFGSSNHSSQRTTNLLDQNRGRAISSRKGNGQGQAGTL